LQVNSGVHLKYVGGWSAKIFKIPALGRLAYETVRESLMMPNEENFVYWHRLEEHSNLAFKTAQPYMLQEVGLSSYGFEEFQDLLEAQPRAALPSEVFFKLPKCIISSQAHNQMHDLVLFLTDIWNNRGTTLFR